jgi:hypothetical protein
MIKELEDIVRRADAMPSRLAQARSFLSNLKAELESSHDLVMDREAETLSLVSAETLPDSVKPLFGNKESREAEQRKRLAADGPYKRLLEDELQAQRGKSEAEIQLNRLQDEDKLIDRQLEAVSASLRAETVQSLRQAILDFITVEARRTAQEEHHG